MMTSRTTAAAAATPTPPTAFQLYQGNATTGSKIRLQPKRGHGILLATIRAIAGKY